MVPICVCAHAPRSPLLRRLLPHPRRPRGQGESGKPVRTRNLNCAPQCPASTGEALPCNHWSHAAIIANAQGAMGAGEACPFLETAQEARLEILVTAASCDSCLVRHNEHNGAS